MTFAEMRESDDYLKSMICERVWFWQVLFHIWTAIITV